MNYLAHAYRFLEEPYVVAGTAIPDWLNVVDRRVRCRAKHAQPWTESSDAVLARTALGIVQHHWDDDWFHANPRFQQLTVAWSVRIRDCLADDTGMRPSFLGHILIEILLDWALSREYPEALDDYYRQLGRIDAGAVQAVVNRIAPIPTDRLHILIPRMIEERFLYDYADDKKLLRRLNQVMRRVKLPELPDDLLAFLPEARAEIVESRDVLLQGVETARSPVEVWLEEQAESESPP